MCNDTGNFDTDRLLLCLLYVYKSVFVFVCDLDCTICYNVLSHEKCEKESKLKKEYWVIVYVYREYKTFSNLIHSFVYLNFNVNLFSYLSNNLTLITKLDTNSYTFSNAHHKITFLT